MSIKNRRYRLRETESERFQLKPFLNEQTFIEKYGEQSIPNFIFENCYKCRGLCRNCEFRSLRNKYEDLRFIGPNDRWILRNLEQFGSVYVNIPYLYSILKEDLMYFGFYDIISKKPVNTDSGIIIYAKKTKFEGDK